jgi:putative DNA primase/helicase
MLPGLPEKGDILDWVQVPGNDRKRLLEVAGETAEWTPQQSAVDLPVTEVVEPAWDEPIHFCEVETPELSVDIFPEWMRDYARAVIDTTQTPPGLTVGMGLAVLAACLQKRFEVVPFGDDYAEPVALWMLTALESGNRKTAVKNALTFPLSDWERVQAQDLAPAIRDGETRRSAIEKRIINLTSRAAGLDNREEREALYREINALKMEIPPTVIPPRVWTDNTTPERLENLLVENDERIALISDEGGIFEVMAGLYTNGRVNINVFLQGHAGGEIRVERQGRQVYLNRPAVTFGLAVQPSVVADLSRGDKRRFRGVGALARFLYILPKSNIGNRDITRRVSIPEGMRGRYALGITDLLDIKPVHDEHGQEVPRKLRFDAEALRLWENFAQFIEENMGSGKELHAIQDWASKLPGAAARIAGLLHVARHRDRCSVIGTETMSKALDLSGALITHALTAFQLMGSNEAMNDARGILDWVMGTRPTQFTRREAQRAVRALEGDRLDKALKVLVDRNFIGEPTKRGGGPGKGPPSTVYVVNPRMYETFS